jgi:hypothetical protein
MKKPTVGRKDHSRGYVSGNYEWQEFGENVREANSRNYTNGTGKFSDDALRTMAMTKTGQTQDEDRKNNTRLCCLEGRCSHPSHEHRRGLS